MVLLKDKLIISFAHLKPLMLKVVLLYSCFLLLAHGMDGFHVKDISLKSRYMNM